MSEKEPTLSREEYIQLSNISGKELIDNPELAHDMANASNEHRTKVAHLRRAGREVVKAYIKGMDPHGEVYRAHSAAAFGITWQFGDKHGTRVPENPAEAEQLNSVLNIIESSTSYTAKPNHQTNKGIMGSEQVEGFINEINSQIDEGQAQADVAEQAVYEHATKSQDEKAKLAEELISKIR